MDCIILGRKLAQGFIPYWASHSEEEGAAKINSTRKIVFTRTLEESKWAGTTLASGDFVSEISKPKRQEGQDIIVYGGAAFVSNLIKHDLIDDYHLLQLQANEFVSMNLMAFKASVFPYFEKYLKVFLDQEGHELKAEFYLPSVVNEMLATGAARVSVIPAPEKRFGVTYPAHKATTVQQIQALLEAGI